MIEIDDAQLKRMGFSGRIVLCFDQGVLQHIRPEETGHVLSDPLVAEKMEKYGIHLNTSATGRASS